MAALLRRGCPERFEGLGAGSVQVCRGYRPRRAHGPNCPRSTGCRTQGGPCRPPPRAHQPRRRSTRALLTPGGRSGGGQHMPPLKRVRQRLRANNEDQFAHACLCSRFPTSGRCRRALSGCPPQAGAKDLRHLRCGRLRRSRSSLRYRRAGLGSWDAAGSCRRRGLITGWHCPLSLSTAVPYDERSAEQVVALSGPWADTAEGSAYELFLHRAVTAATCSSMVRSVTLRS